MDKAKL